MSEVITRETCEVYRIRGGKASWADIFLIQGKDGEACRISILSDWGNYGDLWRQEDLKDFFISMGGDIDYFSKNFAKGQRSFDEDKTLNDIRTKIIEMRKEDDLDSAEARELWDWLTHEYSRNDDSTSYFHQIHSSKLFDVLFHGDPSQVSYFDEYPGMLRGFMKHVWPVFIATLKEERDVSLREGCSLQEQGDQTGA